MKGMYEKSIKAPLRPKKSGGVEESYVEGARQSKTPKAKSLTPKAPMKKR